MLLKLFHLQSRMRNILISCEKNVLANGNNATKVTPILITMECVYPLDSTERRNVQNAVLNPVVCKNYRKIDNRM